MSRYSLISRLLLWLLIALLLLSSPGATQEALGTAQSGNIHTDRLREVAASVIFQNGPWKRDEVELVAIGPIPSLSFPPGKIEMIPKTRGPIRAGLVTVPVTIKVDGKVVRTVSVSFQVKLQQWVLITRATVPHNTRMEDVPVERARRVVVGTPGKYLSKEKDLEGKVSRSYIPSGTVLTYDLLQSPFDVRRGTLVAVVARSGPVEVHTIGKALRDGRRGDRIPVYNPESRKEVEGIVTSPGCVEIRLR